MIPSAEPTQAPPGTSREELFAKAPLIPPPSDAQLLPDTLEKNRHAAVPKRGDPRMIRALELYFQHGKQPAEIAVELQIPLLVLAGWMNRGKWVTRRRQIEQVLLDEYNRRHALATAAARVVVAEEQLEIGKKAESLIDQALTEATAPGAVRLTPRGLKELADAAVAATSIRARVAGITEKAAADATVMTQNDLGNTFVMGAGAKLGKAPVIDTEGEFVTLEQVLGEEESKESLEQVRKELLGDTEPPAGRAQEAPPA